MFDLQQIFAVLFSVLYLSVVPQILKCGILQEMKMDIYFCNKLRSKNPFKNIYVKARDT